MSIHRFFSVTLSNSFIKSENEKVTVQVNLFDYLSLTIRILFRIQKMNEYEYRIPLFGPYYSNSRIVRIIRTNSDLCHILSHMSLETKCLCLLLYMAWHSYYTNVHIYMDQILYFLFVRYFITWGNLFAEGSNTSTRQAGRWQMTKLTQMIITVMFMSPSCLLRLLLRSVWVLSSRSLVISHMEMSSSETLLGVSGTDRVQLV